MYKPIPTQIGTALEADFENGTWTFQMPEGYSVAAGRFAIVDTAVYRDLILAALDVLDNTSHGPMPEALSDALNRLNQLVEIERSIPF